MTLLVKDGCWLVADGRRTRIWGDLQLAILLLVLADLENAFSAASLKIHFQDLGCELDPKSIQRLLVSLGKKSILNADGEGRQASYSLNKNLKLEGHAKPLAKSVLALRKNSTLSAEESDDLKRLVSTADAALGGRKVSSHPLPQLQQLEEYLERKPAWGMDLIGQSATLKDLYVPPRFVFVTQDEVMGFDGRVDATGLLSRVDPGNFPQGIDSFLDSWADGSDPLLMLLGDAGFGKSTALRFFTLRQLRAERHCNFVKLNTLYRDSTVSEDNLLPQITQAGQKALDRCSVLILDGFDEFVGMYPMHGLSLLRTCRILAAEGIQIVLSGRPSAFAWPELRSELGHWHAVTVLPFCFLARRFSTSEDSVVFYTQKHLGELWWQKFSKVTGKGDGQIPEVIRPERLTYSPAAQLSCEPLTTVQVAVALETVNEGTRSRLNSWKVYGNVLRVIWRKEYEEEARSSTSEKLFERFVKTLQVIALASWGTGGRSAPLDRIREVGDLLERTDLVDGLLKRRQVENDSVLLLFYFRRHYGDTPSHDSVEFVHKGFSDYLIARFLIEESDQILSLKPRIVPIISSGIVSREIKHLLEEGVVTDVSNSVIERRAKRIYKQASVVNYVEQRLKDLFEIDRGEDFAERDESPSKAVSDHLDIRRSAYLAERNTTILSSIYRRLNNSENAVPARLIHDSARFDVDRATFIQSLGNSIFRSAKREEGESEKSEIGDLSNISMVNADFQQSGFKCGFSSSYFNNCDFSRARFVGCRFVSSCFFRCGFIDVEFTSCKFDESMFMDCSFEGCRFIDCEFIETNLTESQFSGAYFDENSGRFQGCYMRRANFQDVRFAAMPRFNNCWSDSEMLTQSIRVEQVPLSLAAIGWRLKDDGFLEYVPNEG